MNNQTTPKPSRTKKILLRIVVTLVVAGGLYTVGWWQGRGGLNELRVKTESTIDSLHTEVRSIQKQRTLAENYGKLMEASAGLYKTAVDLDRRNFGTANTHLQQAAQVLETVEHGNEGTNPNALILLTRSIRTTNINVAVDLETQREQVLGFATQLETISQQYSSHP